VGPCAFAQIHASDALHPCDCFCSRASADPTIPKATIQHSDRAGAKLRFATAAALPAGDSLLWKQ
jgi:hypothetical protein